MREALREASLGLGRVHPNPLVGAVLVRKNRIISRGHHAFFGGPHAEVNVVRNSKESPIGATLYVTLEPCAHTGKTPPCANFIAENKIREAVIGTTDPNPLVSGKGVKILKKMGVKVKVGLLRDECDKLNYGFNHWIKKNTPYVIVKTAQSLDGKSATKTGQSRWITGEKARARGHQLRAQVDAILVGVNTLVSDNPRLSHRQRAVVSHPIKIVLDSSLKTPPTANIFSKQKARVWIATTAIAAKKKLKRYPAGTKILPINNSRKRVNIKELLRELGRRGVTSLLVEGGGETIASFFEARAVNEAYFFISPKIIGGREAKTSVDGEGIKFLNESLKMREMTVEKLDEDLLIRGRF